MIYVNELSYYLMKKNKIIKQVLWYFYENFEVIVIIFTFFLLVILWGINFAISDDMISLFKKKKERKIKHMNFV